MESFMDTLVDRRANNNAGLIPFPAPTYMQVRCFFGGLIRAMYRLEVVGADRLPVTEPVVFAPNHDSLLDGIVLGAAISRELRFLAKSPDCLGGCSTGSARSGFSVAAATNSL
jgi:hypothetical protein